MNEFLSQIKNQFNSTKQISFFLINVFQIQIIIIMFMGTSLQFFRGFQFISDQSSPNLVTINITILVIQMVMFLVIFWEIFEIVRKKNKCENIKKMTAQFIKCYKNILMIPAFYISFVSIKRSQNLSTIVIPLVNILIGIFFCYIKEMCCVSYRFRVRNYFRKFQTTIIDLLLVVLIIAVDCFKGSHYGAMVMMFKNTFRLLKVYYFFQEPMVQKVQIFYNLYQLMISTMIIASQFLQYNLQQNLACVCAILVFGGIIITNATQTFSFSIYNQMISTSNLLLIQQQGDNFQDNQQGMIKKHFNQIRVMSMIYLQKQKYQQKQQNQFQKWWQFFNRKVLIHKANCINPKCKCLLKKLPDSDIHIFLKQLINDIRQLSVTFSKQMKLKIMTIYMYIEILKKPLKAYYELMRLKSQKKSDSFDIQLADLSTQTRQCFDQLFLKNKVKNQKLQLVKVIEFEQYVQQCQNDLKKIISQTMQFYSNFNYNTIKISQIKEESNNLQQLKLSFQSKLLKILNGYSSNLKLSVLIHLFYNYIQVYQNKQSQMKKISHQQLFKKRIFDKKQINVFSQQYGSVFIDLVQQRGKIKNLTKNMCTVYGYPKQDMVSYNINLFMPRLFGKHHAKFLHNFIEKSKFRLLKQSARSVFGKNKKKFLFPMKITLKAEYLQDNYFGSSSLLRPIETFSQFMIVDKYGKIQEMTEGIYKRIFSSAFGDQNQKVCRLHINKLIPSYNVFYQNVEQKVASYDKIIQGTLIYCEDSNYLIQKFKFIKDFNKANKNFTSNNSNNLNYTISITDITNTTISYSKEQMQINLNDAMKYFLMDLEMFLLKGVKIAYKVTPVITAQFQAQLLQIVSVKNFVNQHSLYENILNELSNLLQLFTFHLQDLELIKCHLSRLQSQLETKQYSSSQSHSITTTQPEYTNSMYNLIGQDAPRQIKKATKLTFQDIQSVQFQDNNRLLIEDNIAQKASINNSSLDTLQNDSKRQILINAFSNGDKKIINSKFSKIAYLAILILLGLLVTLLTESVGYLNLLAVEWRSISHVLQMKNILQYRKSLIEIQEYQLITNKQQPSAFIQTQIQMLNDKFKMKIQNIYQSVVSQQQFNRFYTEQFLLENSVTQQKQTLSFVQLFKQILWRFSYSIQQSTEYLRSYYESITNKFTSLQQSQQHFLLQTQQTTSFNLYMINMVYLVLIIITGLGVLPVFMYFKNQQKTMIQLLQYISFIELKKSLKKLSHIQTQLNKLDKIDNFQHMKNQIKSNLLLINRDYSNNFDQSLHTNKSPRIIASTTNTNTAKQLTKSIFWGVLIVIFLSNLPLWTMLQLNYISTQFKHSVNVNKMVYEMEIKPSRVLNVYLMNVNTMLKGDDRVNISSSLQQEMSMNYFTTQSLLSKPTNNKLTISQRLFPLLQQSLCQYLGQSSQCNIDKQMTFKYLVYLFKNKFQFLSMKKNGNNPVNINKKIIEEWMDENRIGETIQSIKEVISISEQVNRRVYEGYQNKFNINTYYLIAIGVVLIIFNTVILFLVQYLTFHHFNSVLKQTQNVFSHFDLDTLSENTYLTSYFNAKIKDSK